MRSSNSCLSTIASQHTGNKSPWCNISNAQRTAKPGGPQRSRKLTNNSYKQPGACRALPGIANCWLLPEGTLYNPKPKNNCFWTNLPTVVIHSVWNACPQQKWPNKFWSFLISTIQYCKLRVVLSYTLCYSDLAWWKIHHFEAWFSQNLKNSMAGSRIFQQPAG